MEVLSCERTVGWNKVYKVALKTQGKTVDNHEPSDEWKRKIVRAPHSPIRVLRYLISFTCPYFVSVHLVRHKHGVEWFVSTQRNDRQEKYDRRAARQDVEVMVTCDINAEEIMFISRRRLCNMASPETRETWAKIVEAIGKIDPILEEACVPECVFRGFCPEIKGCGYANSHLFTEEVNTYRSQT